MEGRRHVAALAAVTTIGTIVVGACHRHAPKANASEDVVPLPSARISGGMSLDEALAKRRSSRSFGPAPSRAELGQLLWAAQGVTDPAQGLRAAPSAGAIHPLVVFVVSADGTFRYEPATHALRRLSSDDRRAALSTAALEQTSGAGTSLVVVARVDRTRAKYGARAERYVALEAGHAVQNVLLEATAHGLAAVPIGAFDDDAVRAVVGVDKAALPLYVVPIGRRG
jgi:SagB-type dehydrogenase family enzyme